MSDRSAIEQAIKLYFEAMNSNDASIVPLSDDVIYNGPMMPEPIRGEAAVRNYLAETSPFIARIEQKEILIDGLRASVILEFEGLNGVVLEGAEFFWVKDGLILEARIFFDTRILLKGVN